MHMHAIYIVALTSVITLSCGQTPTDTQPEKKGPAALEVKFLTNETDKKVDVMVGDQLFTSYRWPDDVLKPVLYPILTAAGTPITRGFPIDPREGERTDHPHHVGMWLNYGNVNGYDIWNNSPAIEAARKPQMGSIHHVKIEQLNPGEGEGSMSVSASWVDAAGKGMLAEKTEYHFIASGEIRIIDRLTTLTATSGPVTMKDTKEGLLGIRVSRQLELPSDESLILTDAQGKPTTVKKMSNEGVSGNYRSSEGVTGEEVWSTRARWMDLYGQIGNEKISLVICDHPKNLNYPTYWHARGYGLFAANPFGVKDFTKGKETLNYTIPAGDSITFKYRVIVSSGTHLSDAEINAYAEEFGKKY